MGNSLPLLPLQFPAKGRRRHVSMLLKYSVKGRKRVESTFVGNRNDLITLPPGPGDQPLGKTDAIAVDEKREIIAGDLIDGLG